MYAAARLGLEETDFLSAKAVEERVGLIGVALTWPSIGSMTMEAAYTNRTFDGIVRVDRKYEFQWRGQRPLTDDVTLTAQAGYLTFESSLGVATDQATAMLGVVYALR